MKQIQNFRAKIAANPNVQDKLRIEIDEAYNNNGKLEHDDIHNLQYLDMVFSGE